MDIEYILTYFYNKEGYHPASLSRQADVFWDILIEYKNFYEKNKDIIITKVREDRNKTNKMNTSVTKVIDNIVVGLVLLEK